MKAEQDAIDKWHPLFANIVEEEAQHGSYEQFEENKQITGEGSWSSPGVS